MFGIQRVDDRVGYLGAGWTLIIAYDGCIRPTHGVIKMSSCLHLDKFGLDFEQKF